VRKGKFTEERIAFALKQAEPVASVEQVCRKMDISDLLRVAHEVRRRESVRAAPTALTRVREPQTEADRGRSDPGQGLVAAPRLGTRVDAAFRMQPAQRVARGEDVGVDLLVQAGQEGRVG
jgi:putative transposase